MSWDVGDKTSEGGGGVIFCQKTIFRPLSKPLTLGPLYMYYNCFLVNIVRNFVRLKLLFTIITDRCWTVCTVSQVFRMSMFGRFSAARNAFVQNSREWLRRLSRGCQMSKIWPLSVSKCRPLPFVILSCIHKQQVPKCQTATVMQLRLLQRIATWFRGMESVFFLI